MWEGHIPLINPHWRHYQETQQLPDIPATYVKVQDTSISIFENSQSTGSVAHGPRHTAATGDNYDLVPYSSTVPSMFTSNDKLGCVTRARRLERPGLRTQGTVL